jgi:hypothetical protein
MSEQAAFRFAFERCVECQMSQNKLTDILPRTYEKWYFHRQQNVMGAAGCSPVRLIFPCPEERLSWNMKKQYYCSAIPPDPSSGYRCKDAILRPVGIETNIYKEKVCPGTPMSRLNSLLENPFYTRRSSVVIREEDDADWIGF